MIARPTLIALALASMATCAHAGILSEVVGTVSVNRGNGFRPVTNGFALNDGDLVSVAPGGRAVVSCGPGLFSPVIGGQTVSVACRAASLPNTNPSDTTSGNQASAQNSAMPQSLANPEVALGTQIGAGGLVAAGAVVPQLGAGGLAAAGVVAPQLVAGGLVAAGAVGLGFAAASALGESDTPLTPPVSP